MGVNKMLTLNLSAYEMQQLEHASQQAGMSVNQYAVSRLFPKPPKQAPTLYDMAMAYEGADVSEIEFEPTPKLPSKNRFMELD